MSLTPILFLQGAVFANLLRTTVLASLAACSTNPDGLPNSRVDFEPITCSAQPNPGA